jgi:hypothetical protein
LVSLQVETEVELQRATMGCAENELCRTLRQWAEHEKMPMDWVELEKIAMECFESSVRAQCSDPAQMGEYACACASKIFWQYGIFVLCDDACIPPTSACLVDAAERCT